MTTTIRKRVAKLELAAAARLNTGPRLTPSFPIMRGDTEWRRLTAEGHTEAVGPLQPNGAQHITLAGRRVFVADEPLPA